MNLEPNSLIYENTNYIRLKLGLNRYNFRVGFWILGKTDPNDQSNCLVHYLHHYLVHHLIYCLLI